MDKCKDYSETTLLDKLRMFHGIAPYNTPGNICYADGYFWNSLVDKFGKEAVEAASKEVQSAFDVHPPCLN